MSEDATRFAEELRRIIASNSFDAEATHAEMDKLIVGKLRELGYGAAMDLYEAEEKWYA